jgi:hypothetical protein
VWAREELLFRFRPSGGMQVPGEPLVLVGAQFEQKDRRQLSLHCRAYQIGGERRYLLRPMQLAQ